MLEMLERYTVQAYCTKKNQLLQDVLTEVELVYYDYPYYEKDSDEIFGKGNWYIVSQESTTECYFSGKQDKVYTYRIRRKDA